MPKKGPARRPHNTNHTLKSILKKDAEETDRSGARAYRNSGRTATSGSSVNKASDDQIKRATIPRAENAYAILQGSEMSGARAEMPLQNSLAIPRTPPEDQGSTVNIGATRVAGDTVRIAPSRQQDPAATEMARAHVSIRNIIGHQRPMMIYPVIIMFANRIIETANAIFNQNAPRSAISGAFLRMNGISPNHLPPSNNFRSPAITPAGLVDPQMFVSVTTWSKRLRMPRSTLDLVVLDDSPLTQEIDIFFGVRIFEKCEKRHQPLQVVDSGPFAPQTTIGGRGSSAMAPNLSYALAPSPPSLQFQSNVANEFGWAREAQLITGSDAFMGIPSQDQIPSPSNGLMPVPSQWMETSFISSPSGATSTAESVFSFHAMPSLVATENTVPNDGVAPGNSHGQFATTGHVEDDPLSLDGDFETPAMSGFDDFFSGHSNFDEALHEET